MIPSSGLFRAPEGGWGRYRAALDGGWRWYRVDVAGSPNMDDLHHAFVTSLGLANWYGHNLDALADALRSVVPEGARGVVLEIERADAIAQNGRWPDVMDLLTEASHEHIALGEGFCVLIAGEAGSALPALPD